MEERKKDRTRLSKWANANANVSVLSYKIKYECAQFCQSTFLCIASERAFVGNGVRVAVPYTHITINGIFLFFPLFRSLCAYFSSFISSSPFSLTCARKFDSRANDGDGNGDDGWWAGGGDGDVYTCANIFHQMQSCCFPVVRVLHD